MTRTAIVSAMHEELSALLALMPDERKVSAAGRDFWVGHLHGHDVVVVLSRIGKVAAATTAAVLVERFGVTRILFTGVAGALAKGVNVGDVVVSTSLLQHDMDASPIFPKYEIPLYGVSRFEADASLVEELTGAATAVLSKPVELLGQEVIDEFHLHAPRVHQGLIVSGDRFVSTAGESHALREALPEALAVEMEGAAVAQVCHDYGIPFVAVRTISDSADDAAHGDFTRFVGKVAKVYSAGIVERWLGEG
jgi:adenosylhomocysteine nucleosidase